MASESLTDALGRLDPARRSLLDLSLRRGMDASEIADVLGAEVDSIVRLREGALEEVATEIGLAGAAHLDAARDLLAELPADEWRLAADRAPPRNGVPAPKSATNGSAPPPGGTAPPRKRPGRGRLVVELAVVAAAVAIVLALALRGGDTHHAAPQPTRPAQHATPPPRSATRPPPGVRPFARLPDAPPSAGGSIRLVRNRRAVYVTISGLAKPQGAYGVWLFNSAANAIPIGHFASGSASGTLPIPRRAARRFRAVDVSLQPSSSLARNGSLTVHSGPSLLRARLR